MPTTTSFEFGDVILVPFPFTDQSASKKRPAVVISSARYHKERPDIVLMAITSQMRPSLTVGEAIVHRWQDAGLLKPSVLKPLVTTVEKSLVLRKMGKLHPDDCAELHKVIDDIIG